MKKYTSMAMLLGVCFAMTACGSKQPAASTVETVQTEETEAMANMVNPMTEYTSLDALNAVSGTKLVKPGVMGITDEHFYLIQCGDYNIAEYTYNLNGINYVLRGAPVTEDISGVYLRGKAAFDSNGSQEFIFEDDMKLARWFNTEGQYVFMSKDDGKLEEKTFTAMAGEIKTLTNQFTNNGGVDETDGEGVSFVYDVSSLTGDYEDSYSQRAHLEAVATEDGALDITVYWGSSASETSEWHMTGWLTADGRLEYDDCENLIVRSEESGDSSTELIYDGGSGYFTVENNKLLWNGAADENCRDCVFEKVMPE